MALPSTYKQIAMNQQSPARKYFNKYFHFILMINKLLITY